MGLGGEGLWCGASLRPWQILHSRLAQIHICPRLELDVWELIDQTVEAANYPSEYKVEEELHFLDLDDGELWRHGGLMEGKIRDWLTSKLEEEEGEGEDEEEEEEEELEEEEYPLPVMHAYYHEYSSATFSREFSRLEEDVDSSVNYIEENEENYSYSGAYNMAGAADLAAPLNTDHCQVSEDWHTKVGADSKEEDEAVCAVCLEKLWSSEGLNDITHLPCRHSFHSCCLSPWLMASSICPCCRAPIPLSFPPNLEAPLDLDLSNYASACSDRVQMDMMGLLAEMEAALDRFGLLS